MKPITYVCETYTLLTVLWKQNVPLLTYLIDISSKIPPKSAKLSLPGLMTASNAIMTRNASSQKKYLRVGLHFGGFSSQITMGNSLKKRCLLSSSKDPSLPSVCHRGWNLLDSPWYPLAELDHLYKVKVSDLEVCFYTSQDYTPIFG